MSLPKRHMVGLITQTLKVNGSSKFCQHAASADDKLSETKEPVDSRESFAFRGDSRGQTAVSKRRRKAREMQPTGVPLQPTFRLEPTKKFDSSLISKIIQQVLHDLLDGKDYDVVDAAAVPQSVCDEIKKKVKQLALDRYKLVVVAAFGQKQQQGIHVVSRCSWDSNFDNYASATHATALYYCTATVYGIYYD